MKEQTLKLEDGYFRMHDGVEFLAVRVIPKDNWTPELLKHFGFDKWMFLFHPMKIYHEDRVQNKRFGSITLRPLFHLTTSRFVKMPFREVSFHDDANDYAKAVYYAYLAQLEINPMNDVIEHFFKKPVDDEPDILEIAEPEAVADSLAVVFDVLMRLKNHEIPKLDQRPTGNQQI